jgi:hypothetical protein
LTTKKGIGYFDDLLGSRAMDKAAPKTLTIANIFFLFHPGSVGTIQSTG